MHSTSLFRRSLPILAICVTFGTQVSFAQSTTTGIGIGIASQQQPYVGAGSKTRVFPALAYDGQYLRLAGDTADLKLATHGQLTFGLRGRLSFSDGYKASDAPIFSGMADRKSSLWLGCAATWNADFVKISVDVLGDASGHSKGLQSKTSIERDFPVSSFIFTPHAALLYADKKYVAYYYGVRSEEATLTRAEDDGSSTISVQAGLRSGYAFNPKNLVFLDVSATALGNGITKSPLVDKHTVPVLALSYLYRF